MAKKIPKTVGRNAYSKRVEASEPKGKWQVIIHQDEKAFATAADKYAADHVTSEKKARSALEGMGIITPTGRLSKHYK